MQKEFENRLVVQVWIGLYKKREIKSIGGAGQTTERA
jgi:hypothetical protein